MGRELNQDKNKDIVEITMDKQSWYDWVRFQLANGKIVEGKVHIYTYLDWDEWVQAIRQLLSEKYGYNINFIPVLSDLSLGDIKFCKLD